MNNYGLGYSLKDEDHDILRSNHSDLLFRATSDFVPPAEVDPRKFVIVKDQGQMSSCAGNSTASGCEIINYNETADYVQFSAMYAYLEGQKVGGYLGSDQGCSIGGVTQSLLSNGIATESAFPYPNHYDPTIPKAAEADGKARLLKTQSTLTDYQSVFTWLSSRLGTVEIGIHWYRSMSVGYCPAVIEKIVTDKYLGDHAMQLVGYSQRKSNDGRNYIWLLNSHGPNWANKGFAEVNPGVIDYWFRVGSVMVGITDLAHDELKPRPFKWSDAL